MKSFPIAGDSATAPKRVAVVGAGPKGFYALQRLLVRIEAEGTPQSVVVDIYNSSELFGSGPVYGPASPDYFLLNYASSNVDIWTEELRRSGLIRRTPGLVEWAQGRIDPLTSSADFLPRNVAGMYLREGFSKVVEKLREVAEVNLCVAIVDGIEGDSKEGYEVSFSNSKHLRRTRIYDCVLICSGHSFRPPNGGVFGHENDIGSFYQDLSVLDRIAPGSAVSVRGLGLTFFDLALALTEGRGGSFERGPDGKLFYCPSGREPGKIYPYSRSGRVMSPRPPIGPGQRSSVHSFDPGEERWSGTAIDFEKQIWPVLRGVYEANGCCEKTGLPWKKIPEKTGFGECHRMNVGMLSRNLSNIRNGRKCALRSEVWMRAVPRFRELYALGGLTPESQRVFDGCWEGVLASISFGPPPETGEKILALAEAGLLHFGFARSPRIEPRKSKFRLARAEKTVDCDFHICATIPRLNELAKLTPLFLDLERSGLGRKFSNGGYRPGCLEINREGRLINQRGIPERIFLYGKPTEGCLFDNDTLSTEVNDTASSWAKSCVEKNSLLSA